MCVLVKGCEKVRPGSGRADWTRNSLTGSSTFVKGGRVGLFGRIRLWDRLFHRAAGEQGSKSRGNGSISCNDRLSETANQQRKCSVSGRRLSGQFPAGNSIRYRFHQSGDSFYGSEKDPK